MCQHQPPCPPADAPDREAAHVVASHPEQGWSLLCNGVVMFEDTGALLPDGRSIPPHRPAHLRVTARLPRLRRPPRPVTACAGSSELTCARSLSASRKDHHRRSGWTYVPRPGGAPGRRSLVNGLGITGGRQVTR